MKVQILVGVALLASMSLMLTGRARADVSYQTVKVTFSQPVQIPGRILPAGAYTFVMAEPIDQKIVKILSEDGSKLIAFVQTIDRDRAVAANGVRFTVAERGAGEPAAVVDWFFPGETTGHEFIYPRQEERQLARAKQDIQVSGD